MADRIPTPDRFWSKVNKTETCWLWTGGQSSGGYGSFSENGVTVKPHRYAYELLVRPIPDGMQIDHLCKVRHCVNPAHLAGHSAGQPGAPLASRRVSQRPRATTCDGRQAGPVHDVRQGLARREPRAQEREAPRQQVVTQRVPPRCLTGRGGTAPPHLPRPGWGRAGRGPDHPGPREASMTLAAPRTLHQLIADARGQQLKARAAWVRSANAGTIAATKLADRELDVLLDRLSAALRNRNVVT